jgi:very-short-patch-repair endonuclease
MAKKVRIPTPLRKLTNNEEVVEVDGATHSTNEEIMRDASRTSFLERLGYTVIRVQNDDVYNAVEGVLRTIQLALESVRT